MRQTRQPQEERSLQKNSRLHCCKQHFFAARCPYVSNGKAREILEWNFAKKLNIYDCSVFLSDKGIGGSWEIKKPKAERKSTGGSLVSQRGRWCLEEASARTLFRQACTVPCFEVRSLIVRVAGGPS
jgi:hypothetical protein